MHSNAKYKSMRVLLLWLIIWSSLMQNPQYLSSFDLFRLRCLVTETHFCVWLFPNVPKVKEGLSFRKKVYNPALSAGGCKQQASPYGLMLDWKIQDTIATIAKNRGAGSCQRPPHYWRDSTIRDSSATLWPRYRSSPWLLPLNDQAGDSWRKTKTLSRNVSPIKSSPSSCRHQRAQTNSKWTGVLHPCPPYGPRIKKEKKQHKRKL